MVLASPRPPVDPDDVSIEYSKNIQPISFKFDMWVDTPRGTFNTLRALEQQRSQPNDTYIPQIFKMQYLHKHWSDYFQILCRGEVSEATYKMVNDYNNTYI